MDYHSQYITVSISQFRPSEGVYTSVSRCPLSLPSFHLLKTSLTHSHPHSIGTLIIVIINEIISNANAMMTLIELKENCIIALLIYVAQ